MDKQTSDKALVIANIRMTKEQRETMAEIAFEHEVPLRDILCIAVDEFVERRQKDNGVIAITRKKLMIKKELEKNEQFEKLLTQAKNLNSEVLKHVNESRESKGH